MIISNFNSHVKGPMGALTKMTTITRMIMPTTPEKGMR